MTSRGIFRNQRSSPLLANGGLNAALHNTVNAALLFVHKRCIHHLLCTKLTLLLKEVWQEGSLSSRGQCKHSVEPLPVQEGLVCVFVRHQISLIHLCIFSLFPPRLKLHKKSNREYVCVTCAERKEISFMSNCPHAVYKVLQVKKKPQQVGQVAPTQ